MGNCFFNDMSSKGKETLKQWSLSSGTKEIMNQSMLNYSVGMMSAAG